MAAALGQLLIVTANELVVLSDDVRGYAERSPHLTSLVI
jgi:hypothetical protein